MKIIYIGNKEEQIIMKVGRIKKGIPKEVPDKIARDLVDGKNYVEFIEFEPPVVINSPRYEGGFVPADSELMIIENDYIIPKSEYEPPVIPDKDRLTIMEKGEIVIPKDFVGMVPVEPLSVEIITTDDEHSTDEVIPETKKKKWRRKSR